MTSSFSVRLRAAAASRSARTLLLVAAVLTSAPFAAPLVLGLRAAPEKIASVFVCFASGAPKPGAQ
jgi:hypothetical protein